MRKLFYLLFVAVFGLGIVSCKDDDPKPRENGGEQGGGQGGGGQEEPGESDLDVKFTADQFWCGYYGDYLGLGTGFYLLEINNGSIDDSGYLTSTGYAITLALNGEMPAKGETVTLPVGTYKTDLGLTDNYKIINEDVGFFLSFVEMKFDDDDTFYTDFISDGTMKVTNNGNGTYTIACDLNMFYEDEEGNPVADGNMKGTYTGAITVDSYVVESPYDVLEGDFEFESFKASTGFFYQFTKSELSNYYLTLFDVDVDLENENNPFKGPGYAMTIDLYTEQTDAPDLNMLNNTFNIAELNEFEEWTFQPGTVDEYQGKYYWSGTYLDEITELEDEDGKYYGYGKSVMVTGGTITGSYDGENVTFELDLTTEADGHIKGTYKGALEVQIPEDNQIEAIQAKKVKAANDLMRPFSKYERIARKSAKAAARKEPRKLEMVTRSHTRR